MKKLFALLIVALMVGCVGTPLFSYTSVSPEEHNQNYMVRPVYIDKSFNEKELADIQAVVKEWNYVLNGYFIWQIEPVAIDHTDMKALTRLSKQIRQTHEGIMILGLDHDNELIEDVVDEYDGTLAFVNNLGMRANLMVVIRDRMGHKNLQKILLHEFGHAMGGRHVEAESLMYPYYGPKQYGCVDKITALQAASYFDLKVEHMNYCSTPNLR